MNDVTRDQKAAGVGAIPSGLFIICTKNNQNIANGFLASWVQQVSFEPLMVSLCINPTRPGYEEIIAGKLFTINVVGEHEKAYLKHFWSGYAPENNPFSEIKTSEFSDGGIIMDDAKTSILCRMKEALAPGDHQIIIAEVLDSKVLEMEAKPYVHIRKTGLDY